MSVKRDMIADTMKTDAYKVKCINCIACEGDEEIGYYCDHWSTDIFDVTRAYCSDFTPHPIDTKGGETDEER